MKTAAVVTALIAAVAAGAASAQSYDLGLATATDVNRAISTTSDAQPRPGDLVQVEGTNIYYIHDAANASSDSVGTMTPAERLARIMN